MIPPEGDARTYEGRDAHGNPWLLYWSLPGAPDVWSALGLDHRRYPCARVLQGEHAGLIVSAKPATIPSRKVVTRSTLARRYRKMVEAE